MRRHRYFLAVFTVLFAATSAVEALPTPVTDAIVTPGILGEGWTQSIGTGGIIPVYEITPDVEHSVRIGLSDGSWAFFDMILTPASQALLPLQFTAASFAPRAGTVGTLTAQGDTSLIVQMETESVVLYDWSFFMFDPRQYCYELGDEVYLLDKRVLLIPVPGAVLLSVIGAGLVGGLRRRRTI